MKCPLIGIANLAEWRRESPTEADCLKEECAWYIPEDHDCVIPAVATWLPYLAKGLNSIAKELTLLRPPGAPGL